MAGPLERLSDSPVTHENDFMTPKSVQEMTPRQRKNAKRISTPVKHSSHGGGSRRYLCRRESASELYDGIDPEIFFRLGVAIVDPLKNSVARKDLVAKILAAVKDDLQIVAQENMEAEMREIGFRRWAGKTAWNNIKDVRQTLDWATGQKIDPLTHRPTSDMNAPPFLDENGIEDVRPDSDFDEHAVKLPSIGASTGLEDSDNVSNPEFTSIHLSHLPKITEESFDEDVQVFIKNVKCKTDHGALLSNSTSPAVELTVRKSFANSQRLSAKRNSEAADFSPEATVSKLASRGEKADTPKNARGVHYKGRRQIFQPHQ